MDPFVYSDHGVISPTILAPPPLVFERFFSHRSSEESLVKKRDSKKMRVFFLVLLFSQVAMRVRSFVVAPKGAPRALRSSNNEVESEKTLLSLVSRETVSEYVQLVPANVRESLKKDSGSSQVLVVLQLALIGALAFGSVPFVGEALEFAAGPGLLLSGLALIATGILELGPKNLTPSLNPVDGNELKTNGPYALARHPIYAGLILFALGLAICTHSFQRVLITALLYLLLDLKSSKEEDALLQLHPAYPAYQATVPKLLPGINSLFGDKNGLFSNNKD